jgi:hypothetical protein
LQSPTMAGSRQLSLCKRRSNRTKQKKKIVQLAAAVAAQAVTTTVATATLRSPDDVGLNSALEQTLLKLTEANRPENTKKAYDGKIKEWFEFCDAKYGEEPYKYIVNSDKLYRYFWHLAFREKNPKRTRDGPKFDVAAYDAIMLTYQRNGHTVNFELVHHPTNPVSGETFDQYKAVLKKLHRQQVAERVNNSPWEMIWTQPFDELQQYVKQRRPKAKKANYEEKVDGVFGPYEIVERYSNIEERLFQDSMYAVGGRSLCTALRHRCCALYTTSAILRCDFLHRAELSDFLGIMIPQKETDVHPMYTMILV